MDLPPIEFMVPLGDTVPPNNINSLNEFSLSTDLSQSKDTTARLV